MSVDPRLRVLYLGAVAVGAFALKDWRMSAGLLGAHAIAWLLLGLGPRALARQIWKLWGFSLLIIGTYALTSEAADVDRWVAIDLRFWTPHLNIGAAIT